MTTNGKSGPPSFTVAPEVQELLDRSTARREAEDSIGAKIDAVVNELLATWRGKEEFVAKALEGRAAEIWRQAEQRKKEERRRGNR